MPQKAIMELCIKKGIDCVDLLPAFLDKASNGDYYYKIDGHWNENGHELAAGLIYENLIKK